MNGYRAMGVADGGALVVGNKADLVVVDLRRAHLVPVMRVVSDLLHQGQAGDVASVMVDGRWVMRDGVFLSIDEERIIAEAETIARRAWQRLFAANPKLPVPAGFVPA